MRTLLSLALIAIATCAVTAADEDKYKSKDGKFAVGFPKDAEVKKDLKAAGGGIEMKLFTVEAKGRAFIVMYMDLPDAAKNVPANQILDGAEKGSVSQSGGKLEKSKEIAFGKGKLPGRELLINKDGNKIRSWVIVDGTRVYVLAVGGPKDFAIGKDGEAFLKSFEITK